MPNLLSPGWLASALARGRPAATAALLRDTGGDGVEVLLLRKEARRAFGGLWVFPGGGFESADNTFFADGSCDVLSTAKAAASREAAEETGLVVPRDALHFHSHWCSHRDSSGTSFATWGRPLTLAADDRRLPPEDNAHRRRYSTFFFVGAAEEPDAPVRVDGGEIEAFAWLRPEEALGRHADGALPMLPPTWMTLESLARHGSSIAAARAVASAEPIAYETRSAELSGGRSCFMWAGDAGYESGDPAVSGARHRIERSVEGVLSLERSSAGV